ncbi:hypothetical protein ACWD4G_20350 [Streptomyces sp. NPDC002643]
MFARRYRPAEGAVPFNTIDKMMHLLPQKDRDGLVALRLRGTPPTAGELCALLADVTERIPALGYRVGGRRWHRYFEPCEVDLPEHVAELRFPAGRSLASCLREAAEREWPTGRPPWGVLVISGYREDVDEYLIAYRVSHLLQDGIAMALTGNALFTGERLPPPARVPAPRPQPPSSRGPLKLGPPKRERRTGVLRKRGPGTGVPRSGQLWKHGLWTGVRHASKVLLPCAEWLPLAAHPADTGWRYSQVSLDRAVFDDITRSTGASTAQVLLAVICGALRDWTPEYWTGHLGRRQRRGLATMLTMSLRAPRDRTALGNQVGMYPFTLPCAEPSPERRLRLVMDRTDHRVLSAFRALQTRAMHAPDPLGRLLARTLVHCERPCAVVTVVPSSQDPKAMGAEDLLCVSQRPKRVDGGFVVVQGPETILVQPSFKHWVDRVDHLPALLTASLAELHAAVVPDRATARPSPEHASSDAR